MKTLILALFSDSALFRLRDTIEVTYENWLETGEFQDPEELGARLARENYRAIIVEGDFLFEETFELASDLRFIGVCRASVSHVDVVAATSRGIAVVNTPGRNAEAVAELTLGLMFALARRVAEGDRYIRNGHWESPLAPYTDLRGLELSGKTVGIVGFGAIGRQVARLCRALGMRVMAYDPFVTAADAETGGAVWADPKDVFSSADFVTFHCPPPEDGKPLLDSEAVDNMRRGAFIINTASEELVDINAVADALRSNRLGGAAFDVFGTTPVEPSHPLIELPNTVLTPHIGGATDETVERHSHMMVDDLLRFLDGKRPLNLVNPDVWEKFVARE